MTRSSIQLHENMRKQLNAVGRVIERPDVDVDREDDGSS
jgi:hypothetical protein